MPMAAIFMVSLPRKPPKCPSIGVEINKLGYVLTREPYSAI